MVVHTFVIPAYRESPYLEDCIKSLLNQRIKSEIIMVTSTDNSHIRDLSKEYGIPLFINKKESGITWDWNFGLSKVKTKYATIAHQDDIYDNDYSLRMLEYLNKSKYPLIAFSNYYEIRGKCKAYNTSMLRIKKFLLFPLRVRFNWGNIFLRRRSLSLGDPIPCPSVTFCLDNIPMPLFKHRYRSCEDWEAWEMLSKLKGDFVYVPKALMGHRIHSESETSKILADGARIQENYEMFRKFWPAFLAKIINRYYTKSEESNNL